MLILTLTLLAKNSSFLLPFLLYLFNDIQHREKQFSNPQHVVFGKLNKNAPLCMRLYQYTSLQN